MYKCICFGFCPFFLWNWGSSATKVFKGSKFVQCTTYLFQSWFDFESVKDKRDNCSGWCKIWKISKLGYPQNTLNSAFGNWINLKPTWLSKKRKKKEENRMFVLSSIYPYILKENLWNFIHKILKFVYLKSALDKHLLKIKTIKYK